MPETGRLMGALCFSPDGRKLIVEGGVEKRIVKQMRIRKVSHDIIQVGMVSCDEVRRPSR
jgi:uncharacterized membrane protein